MVKKKIGQILRSGRVRYKNFCIGNQARNPLILLEKIAAIILMQQSFQANANVKTGFVPR